MSDQTLNNLVDEALRRQFEAAWQRGRPAAIEDFLPSPDHPAYLGTLEELVHIDLEFRWKSGTFEGGTPPRAEDYISRFAGLSAPDIQRRLLEQEREVQSRYAPPQPGGSSK